MTSFLFHHMNRLPETGCHVAQQASKKVVDVVLCCLGCVMMCGMLAGCAQQDEWDNDQVGNFEALWTIMDEHYSFFDYKQVDWNEVHNRYRAKLSNQMTDRELFDICGASSSISMGGFFSMARAMDTLWRCPPLSRPPRSPMFVS